MTRFLKREKWQFETACNPCVFNKYTTCPISLEGCREDVFILVPRPPRRHPLPGFEREYQGSGEGRMSGADMVVLIMMVAYVLFAAYIAYLGPRP